MSKKKNLPDLASQYIFRLFKEKLPEFRLYHNYQQTAEIVSVCEDIAKSEDVSDQTAEAIILAAWFQFSGYTQQERDPRIASTKIAQDFLTEHAYSEDCMRLVVQLIKENRDDADPEELPLKILQDATFSHYGRKRFFRLQDMLRIEQELVESEQINDIDWEENNLKNLINHRFYTAYAKSEYSDRKLKNIQKQQENLREMKEGKKYGRGIETLYRSNYRNHINLSAIADGKANMMISLNTIILSVIITLSGAGFTLSQNYLEEHLQFVIPVVILLIGATLSVVFAILSARPTVTTQESEDLDVDTRKNSFLYFGNFLSLGKSGFKKYLSRLKGNQDLLYDSMTMDIYNLGAVLDKKYKLLHYSYNSFMIGLIASVSSLLIIFLNNTLNQV